MDSGCVGMTEEHCEHIRAGEPNPQKNYREITIERNDYLIIRFRGTIEEAGTWYGDASVMREKLRVGCASHSSAAGKRSIKEKTINEILLWRKENRGKKLGYCTNGLIEDQFLIELIGKDCWSIDEHDEQIRRQERERVLDEIRKFYSDLPEYEAGCPFGKMNSDECIGVEGDCETCILNHALESLRREGEQR